MSTPVENDPTLRTDLVTGDAVVLDLRSARLASRGLAFAIDGSIQLALLVAMLIGAGAAAEELGGDDAIIAALLLVATITALIALPVTVETLTRGRSLGKLALGLRVVRQDGSAVRFRHSLVRALFAVVEIWVTTGVIAIIASLVSKDGRRLGDQFAGTYVVRERAPRMEAVRWVTPPELQGWAGQADVSRVPDQVALAARTFLQRANALAPDARWRMACTLADQVQAYVSPAVPPGTHPEAFLIAVIAERGRRAIAATTPPAPQPGWSSAGPVTPPQPAPPAPATPPIGSQPAPPPTPHGDGAGTGGFAAPG